MEYHDIYAMVCIGPILVAASLLMALLQTVRPDPGKRTDWLWLLLLLIAPVVLVPMAVIPLAKSWVGWHSALVVGACMAFVLTTVVGYGIFPGKSPEKAGLGSVSLLIGQIIVAFMVILIVESLNSPW